MPVHLQTTYGKADYAVVENFKTLEAAVNRQEMQLATFSGMATAADLASLRAALQALTDRVNVLARQVSTP